MSTTAALVALACGALGTYFARSGLILLLADRALPAPVEAPSIPLFSEPDSAEQADWRHVRQLLAQGADPNASQADGMTALHWGRLSVYAERRSNKRRIRHFAG